MACVNPDELAGQLEGPNLPIVLDVRTRSQYEWDLNRILGSIRATPDTVVDSAARWISKHPDGEARLCPIAPTERDLMKRPVPGRGGGSTSSVSKRRSETA